MHTTYAEQGVTVREVNWHALTRKRIKSIQAPRYNYQLVGIRRLETDEISQGTWCSNWKIQIRESSVHTDTCLIRLEGTDPFFPMIWWTFGALRIKNTCKPFAYTHVLESKHHPINTHPGPWRLWGAPRDLGVGDYRLGLSFKVNTGWVRGKIFNPASAPKKDTT